MKKYLMIVLVVLLLSILTACGPIILIPSARIDPVPEEVEEVLSEVERALAEIGESIQAMVPDKMKDLSEFREAMDSMRQSLLESSDEARALLEENQAYSNMEEIVGKLLESTRSYYEKNKEGLTSWWKAREEEREEVFERFDRKFDELQDWKSQVLEARLKADGEQFKEAVAGLFESIRQFIESLALEFDARVE